MKLMFRLLFVGLLLFCLTPSVFACTLYDGRIPAKTIKEMYDENDFVLRGKAIYIDAPEKKTSQYNRKVGFVIGKVFKGLEKNQEIKNLEVQYQFVLSADCGEGGTHFVLGNSYFIVAKRLSNGKNGLVHTSGQYGLGYLHDVKQWEKFLEHGVDTPLLDQYCRRGLKQLYGNDVFTGDIIAEDTKYAECEPDSKRYYKRLRVRKN